MNLPSSDLDAHLDGSHATAAFLGGQVEVLGELDYLLAVPLAAPLDLVAVHLFEDGVVRGAGADPRRPGTRSAPRTRGAARPSRRPRALQPDESPRRAALRAGGRGGRPRRPRVAGRVRP